MFFMIFKRKQKYLGVRPENVFTRAADTDPGVLLGRIRIRDVFRGSDQDS